MWLLVYTIGCTIRFQEITGSHSAGVWLTAKKLDVYNRLLQDRILRRGVKKLWVAGIGYGLF